MAHSPVIGEAAVVSTITEPRTESDPVRSWRLKRLIAAGYPYQAALALSEQNDVDLHVAARLLERGCATETALRILF